MTVGVECLGILRDEARVLLDEFANEVNHRIGVEVRQRNACRGLVQTSHVLVRPEQSDVALLVLVGLHALEALKCIVEHAGRRVETQILVRSDACWEPSFSCCPFEREHVIYYFS